MAVIKHEERFTWDQQSFKKVGRVSAEAMKKFEQAQRDYDHKFSSTQVDLPAEIAGKMRDWVAKNILPAELAEDETHDGQFHVTVKYGLHDQDGKALIPLLKGFGAITLRFDKIEIFSNDAAHDVLIIKIKSSGLERLNRLISENMEHTQTQASYVPHATLAYLKKGAGDKWIGNRTFVGKKATVTKITFTSASDAVGSINIPIARRYHLEGEHDQQDHDPTKGKGGGREKTGKTKGRVDKAAIPPAAQGGSLGDDRLNETERKERMQLMQKVEGAAKDWVRAKRASGSEIGRKELAELSRHLGENQRESLDAIISRFDDRKTYEQRPMVHLSIGDKDMPDVWLLGWRQGEKEVEGTPIHDHGASEAGVYVYKGTVQEHIYAIDKEQIGKGIGSSVDFKSVERGFDEKSTAMINAPYIHDIYDQNDDNSLSVTVHSYFPALRQMRFYEVKGDKLVQVGEWDDRAKAHSLSEYDRTNWHGGSMNCMGYHLEGLHDQQTHNPHLGQGEKAALESKFLVGRAQNSEPLTTKTLVMSIDKLGGKLEGLAYKVKSDESLTRKIKQRVEENPGLAPTDVALGISDPLRYTAVFPDDNYTDGVKATINTLTSAGYKIDKVKNYWSPGDSYDGINVAMRTKDDLKVELQFHTPASYDVKEKQSHPIYEKLRTAKDPHEAKTYKDQLQAIWHNVRVPMAATALGALVTG